MAPDVALCAFRIAQEALRNIKRHSDAKNAFVQLTLTDKLEISIRDDGHGFDLSHVNQRQGLGIRSMEERAISLGGIFKIHSGFGEGTTVRALLPFKRATYFSAELCISGEHCLDSTITARKMESASVTSTLLVVSEVFGNVGLESTTSCHRVAVLSRVSIFASRSSATARVATPPTLDDCSSSFMRKRMGVLDGSSTFEPFAIKAL